MSRQLHYEREPFQFTFQYRQRAAGHFYAPSRVDGICLRDPVTTTCQENLEQFRCFAGIDHAALDQVVTQGA